MDAGTRWRRSVTACTQWRPALKEFTPADCHNADLRTREQNVRQLAMTAAPLRLVLTPADLHDPSLDPQVFGHYALASPRIFGMCTEVVYRDPARPAEEYVLKTPSGVPAHWHAWRPRQAESS